jgi:hypothetical protein
LASFLIELDQTCPNNVYPSTQQTFNKAYASFIAKFANLLTDLAKKREKTIGAYLASNKSGDYFF